jgi:hypothetical protein
MARRAGMWRTASIRQQIATSRTGRCRHCPTRTRRFPPGRVVAEHSDRRRRVDASPQFAPQPAGAARPPPEGAALDRWFAAVLLRHQHGHLEGAGERRPMRVMQVPARTLSMIVRGASSIAESAQRLARRRATPAGSKRPRCRRRRSRRARLLPDNLGHAESGTRRRRRRPPASLPLDAWSGHGRVATALHLIR